MLSECGILIATNEYLLLLLDSDEVLHHTYKNMNNYNEHGEIETILLVINALNLQLKIQLLQEAN